MTLQNTIHRLTLHTHAADPYQERYSLERLLQDATLSLPGFPRRGRLVIRHLAMPYSRRSCMWQEHFQKRVLDLWQRAARPRTGWIPPDAEAVFFENDEEHLLCHVQVQGTSVWWKTENQVLLVRQHLECLPAVLIRVDGPQGTRFLSSLPQAFLREVVQHLTHHHLLPDLPDVIQRLVQQQTRTHQNRGKLDFQMPRRVNAQTQKVLERVSELVQAPHAVRADAVEQAAVVLSLLATPQLRSVARQWVEKGFSVVGPLDQEELLPEPSLTQEAPFALGHPEARSDSPPEVEHQQHEIEGGVLWKAASEQQNVLSAAEKRRESLPVDTLTRTRVFVDDLPEQAPLDLVDASQVAPTCIVESRPFSRCAGLLFLLNVFLHLDLITDFSDLSRKPNSPWALLGRVGLMAFEDFREDPLWTLCHTFEDRSVRWTPRIHLPQVMPVHWAALLPDAPCWLQTAAPQPFAVQHPSGVWVAVRNQKAFTATFPDVTLREAPLGRPTRQAERFYTFLQVVLQHALNTPDPFSLLCSNPGRLEVTDTHVDVTYSLEQHPVELRMLGLDRDLGWLPQAGCSISFHFEVDR
ncbi:hypothetical protein [Deinococcus cellulosilyticus]|uniref:Uncharacterized protein n=1 Tax=Deinococcus cellulosilyticus (strain DSM 18568 / NBRC 106333 / KACC 11606 / 5516J-15) TaxID=1223518 RepID=A0A511MZJ6_DEIC1|nr:hypothetical protein [Deinococcus cellulosilyticus]GEM46024.1 hypothetical protein DC3_16590 [Deinococcus cellulosilyticus NBRC 106333 = KACC 11606]